jgi:hypothetical protein
MAKVIVNQLTRRGALLRTALWVLAGLTVAGRMVGQEPVEKPAPAAPIGQFLALPGTIDDGVYGRVNRAALALQARARQENRRGVLVLEVTPGTSPFHQVQGLAKFLTSELPGLTPGFPSGSPAITSCWRWPATKS